MHQINVKDNHVWIIGASSGIGEALAFLFAKEGATVAISSRRKDKLDSLKKKLEGTGHLVVPCDVADMDSLQNCFEEIKKNFSKIDRVIFLPALYASDKETRESLDFIRKSLDVNVMGAYVLSHIIQPYFQKQGYGQIAFCASVAGYIGLPQGQPYSSTKAALINYTESLRTEWEDKNIDVRLINPGFVKTELTDKNNFPMPMIITPEEAACYIIKGLSSHKFEIAFPFIFVIMIKILKTIPYRLYFFLARKMKRDE